MSRIAARDAINRRRVLLRWGISAWAVSPLETQICARCVRKAKNSRAFRSADPDPHPQRAPSEPRNLLTRHNPERSWSMPHWQGIQTREPQSLRPPSEAIAFRGKRGNRISRTAMIPRDAF